MNPLVSVVIPVFNRERLIFRTLDSVWQQSYSHLEIIVVDNNSNDNSVTVIKNWRQQHNNDNRGFKILSEEKRGATYARQKGLENATGELIIFFDSDDTMHPELISSAVREFISDPSLDIVCWKCRLHLLNGKNRIPPVLLKSHLEAHLLHTLLRPQGFMAKTELIKKTGGWNKPLKVWNDLELGFRILQQNPKIKTIDRVLADVYSQSESLTGKRFIDKKGDWEKSLEEIRKDNLGNPDSIRIKTEKILDYRICILAAQYAKEGDKKSAKKLMESCLTKTHAPLVRPYKLCLKFCYNYTRLGFRGAWIIFCGASQIFQRKSWMCFWVPCISF